MQPTETAALLEAAPERNSRRCALTSRPDNQAFRALFTLPPVQTSAGTALTVPEMPAAKVVTGDREVDAVLWLQECVRTGHQVLIDKALEAAKKITTPMEDLGRRYGQYLARQNGSTFAAAFGSMGFGDLEAQGMRLANPS